jgi:hypothetical protein
MSLLVRPPWEILASLVSNASAALSPADPESSPSHYWAVAQAMPDPSKKPSRSWESTSPSRPLLHMSGNRKGRVRLRTNRLTPVRGGPEREA